MKWLYVALVTLLASGLSTGGVAYAQGTSGIPTATPSPLCSVVSLAQISGLAIDIVRTLPPPASSPLYAAPGFVNAVGCEASASGQQAETLGFIFFDTPANADAYYGNQKQQIAAAATGGVPPMADVSAVGDMGFFVGYVLFIAKGPVVIMVNPGDQPDLASGQGAATQLAQLVVGAV
jgi:hypothetical protein